MRDLTETTIALLFALAAILATYAYFSSTVITLINRVVQQFPK